MGPEGGGHMGMSPHPAGQNVQDHLTVMQNLSEQLKAVKLRKSKEPTKDFSDPKTAGFIDTEVIKQYESSVLEVNTENWLEILSTETFPSHLCPLTLEDAQLFLDVYTRNYKDKDTSVVIQTEWRDTLSEGEQIRVKELAERLQSSINIFTKGGGCVFVKTSSRSAKDAPMVQTHFKDLYKRYLSKNNEEERQNENTQVTCLLQAAFEAMKVSTAEQVLDMFMRSERIYQDLLLAAVNQKEVYNEHFVIREFVDIDVDKEFRGFIYKKNLTALSQYNYLIYSKWIADNKDWIQSTILEYYMDVVRPKLTEGKFVEDLIIDFAVCDEGWYTCRKIWVIEINPFLETTDGALFSWQHEKHLLEGTEGFLFRYTERPRPGAKTMLPQSVRELLR
ncbi:hypothetical protein ScPMuIL_015271 [Solemya velum]